MCELWLTSYSNRFLKKVTIHEIELNFKFQLFITSKCMRLRTSNWIAMAKASVRPFIGHVAYILYTGSTYQPVHSCHCHCHSSLWQLQLSLHPYLKAVCVTHMSSSVVKSDTVHTVHTLKAWYSASILHSPDLWFEKHFRGNFFFCLVLWPSVWVYVFI